jgi:tetratricopeptide (TPR) repeat protein
LFETALDKDPNWTEAMVGISDLYAIQKRPPAKLIARINQQVAKAPQNDTYWALLGQTQARSGDASSAKASFEHALGLNKNNSAALLQLAQMAVSGGDINSAAANYEKLIQAAPHNPIPIVMLGTLEESRGNFDKAQNLYQQALQVQPDYPLAANNLAYLMMQHGGNLDVALSLAQTARRGMPDNPSVADTLGWAYYLKGVYGSARDLFEEAEKKDPSNAAVQYHLGLTYDKTSDSAKAALHLKKALELSPNGPDAAAIKQALSGRS